jgi:hypothetical protein
MRVWGILLCFLISACSTIVHGPAEEEKIVSERGEKPKVTEVPLLTEDPKDKAAKTLSDLLEIEKDLGSKKRLYVLPVINKSPYGGEILSNYVYEEVLQNLKKIPEFIVINEIDGSQNFILEGEYFYKFIFEKAKSANVQGILTVQIDDVVFKERGDELGFFRSRTQTAEAKVKMQVYDTVTERLVYSKVGTDDVTEEYTQFLSGHTEEAFQASRAKRAVFKALVKASDELHKQPKKIGWNGLIARIDFHNIFVNTGEASGLIKGQLLNVYSPNEILADPKSKEIIGNSKGNFKGVIKIIDFVGQDAAVAVLVSGRGIKENDRVELSHIKR